MTDKKEIERLIEIELKEANEKYPLFSSPHEAYAVLLEEVEELEKEVSAVRCGMVGAWECVKADVGMTSCVKTIYNNAMFAIQEAIQVAAMCQKTKDSLTNWK